ncbi:MAG: alpha-glucuronidase family glycosyl hydrolase [Mangrovibacterium sp.]
MVKAKNIFILFAGLFLLLQGRAEDGSRLWLRYELLPDSLPAYYQRQFRSFVAASGSPLRQSAFNELKMAYAGLTACSLQPSAKLEDGSILLGTAADSLVGGLLDREELVRCGQEGYLIRSLFHEGKRLTLLAAGTDAGLLYGTFALIRLMQTGQPVKRLDILDVPDYELRLLNHWDNLDGTVERGYAGRSVWWAANTGTGQIFRLYQTYARANASVGINGTVLNNVNASPQVLRSDYIRRYAEIAGLLRPYHIKVYMAVNFSSPMVLDGLPTADPLAPAVIRWWKNKADEIYRQIPDFGGFLVKANSEGQPGPQDFGRSHAEGANMLAAALKPHGGLVMWRAFVYAPSGADRIRQAYDEFMPLDGQFADNVIVQVKNGPLDFQPREPFSPLFGAMQHTSLMIEFQLTQEYLGFSDHLVYLAPLQKECLESDTYSRGKGSTVARATDGSLFPLRHTAIAGVANIGNVPDWCGHPFAQANWYAFGRLAWNNELDAGDLAREWLKMSFILSREFLEPVADIMLRSREAAVNYMTPMGLAHLMGWSHHYGPEPWCEVSGARADWLPSYYHRAAKDGIGFDRTTSGSAAVNQYFSPLKEQFNNPQSCPENLLLWFHHLPWDYRMKSGKSLWEELCLHYYAGVDEVRSFRRVWKKQKGFVDAERYETVKCKLEIQEKEAVWWRDACVLYFQTFSGKEIPGELENPVCRLKDLKKLKFDLKHHN